MHRSHRPRFFSTSAAPHFAHQNRSGAISGRPPASRIVRDVVALVEAWVREGARPDGAVDEAAKFPRQYWRKVREAVARNPEHRVDVVTLSRLAAVAGYQLALARQDGPAPCPFDPITVLALSQRAHRALWAGGIRTVGDLVARTAADLLALPGFGTGCLSDVETALARHGLALKAGAS